MYRGLAIQKEEVLLDFSSVNRAWGEERGQTRIVCACVRELGLVYIIVHTAVMVGERYKLATIGWLVA